MAIKQHIYFSILVFRHSLFGLGAMVNQPGAFMCNIGAKIFCCAAKIKKIEIHKRQYFGKFSPYIAENGIINPILFIFFIMHMQQTGIGNPAEHPHQVMHLETGGVLTRNGRFLTVLCPIKIFK